MCIAPLTDITPLYEMPLPIPEKRHSKNPISTSPPTLCNRYDYLAGNPSTGDSIEIQMWFLSEKGQFDS